MANFCSSCGGEIKAEDKFCLSCGTELSAQPTQAAPLTKPGSENLKKAFEKIKCELSLDEIFGTLGFRESDLIDWRESKWSRRREEESMLKGLFLLTRQNIFFITKAVWPSKLSKESIEKTIVVMPISAIREAKAVKGLFSRKFKMITINGLVSKRGIFFRKERWTKETFYLDDSKSLAEKVKLLNPNIKG